MPMSPRSLRRSAVLLAALMAVTAVLGACGDEPRRTTEALRSDPRPTEATSPSTTELPPRDGGQETPSTTRPPGGGSGDAEELCDRMRDFAGAGASDPEAMIGALQEWRDVAPEELRDDLDAVLGMLETLRSVDQTDPAAFAKVLETLMDPELDEAFTSLGRFAMEECRVQLDPGLGGLPD